MEIRPILSALLRSKTGAVLVAAQVALTLAIVSNAVFVVNARLHTANRPSGLVEDEVFQLQYAGAGDIADERAMVQRDLETLRAIPGVQAVAEVNSFPLSTSGSSVSLTVDERTVTAAVYVSGDSIIDAFGLELVEGRDFDPGEIHEPEVKGQLQADAVILSRHLAQTMFPDAPTAVGEIVALGSGPAAEPMRVVGIVDTLMGPLAQNTDVAYDACILPVRGGGRAGHYAVRTAPGERDRVMAQAEKSVTALRNDRVLIHHRTMETIRERRYQTERSGAGMLVAVTIGLLLVTGSGIVGVASLWVSQRRKQIGVRRALGARRSDILRYFLVENVLITTTGIALGAALAVGLNQVLVGSLELGRLPFDYVLVGMFVMWTVGLAATLGPAWRAATVPPAVATRST